jgi:imidazolonepropionase-like amidohydrolase
MIRKISSVLLYDGKGGKFENTAVAFDEEKILAVGDEAAAMACDEEKNAAGLCLMPGWINAHAHIALDGKPNMEAQVRADNSPAQVALSGYSNCLKALASGIVTIRDMGTAFNASLQLRETLKSRRLPGPRLVTSGMSICMTGGHGNVFGLEADGEDGCRRAARSQIKAGVDLLKVMATGGGQSSGMKAGAVQLSEREIRAVCEEARHAGRITAAHVQGREGVLNCLRAGVDSIEHGVFLDEELIALMVKQDCFFCATLLSPWYVVQYGVKNGIPAFVVEKCKGQVDAHFASFELAQKSGVRIVAGNDAGTPFNFHDDLPGEMKQMVKLGMSVRRVIGAATYTAAQCLQLDHITGSVEKGKMADFTIVEGDPEEDINALNQVRMVYKEGRLLFTNFENHPWMPVS